MSAALQEGAIFADRYRIVRRLAAGGMGAVYEVVHLETNRRRALKVMHPHFVQSDEMRGRFAREARVAADIESEFIVDVFDAGVDDETGMPFMVMELLRGEELGKRLKRAGRLPPGEVTLYLHQTALALDKTHKASIVHRDLKPENLFLTEREDGPPRVKILDFGVAKMLAEGTTTNASTQSLGTPLYMSPEQFNPSMKLSGASDIFSLGMMAYTLLVGKAYWAEESRANNVYAFVSAAALGPREPASARALAVGVELSPGFDWWFSIATATKPADRFPTATAAVRALAEVLGTPIATAGISLSQSGVSPPSEARASLASVPQTPPQPYTMGTQVTMGTQATPEALTPEPNVQTAVLVAPFAAVSSSLNTAMTGRAPEPRRGGLLAAALVLGALLLAFVVVYAVHLWRAPAAVADGGKADGPAQAASPSAAALPVAPPSTSAPEPAVSVASPLPVIAASAAPAKDRSAGAAKPSPVVASPGPGKPPAPPPPAASAPRKKKYTQD